jgi:MFS family permease
MIDSQPPAAATPSRHGAFWAFTTASVLSRVGDQMLMFALPLAVLKNTGSAAAAVIVFAMRGLPYIVSPLLGVLIDRFDRRRMFVAANLLQAVCVVGVAFALDNLYVASALLVVSGLGAVVVGILGYYVLIPDLVEPEWRSRALSHFAACNEVAKLAGPFAAGLVVTLVSSFGAVLLDAASFILAAAVAVVLPALSPPDRGSGHRTDRLRAGFRWIAKSRGVLVLMLTMSVSNLGAGSLDSVFVTYLGRQNISAAVLGGIVTAGPLAGALGAWTSGRLFVRYSFDGRILAWQLLVAVGCLGFLLPGPVPKAVAYAVACFGFAGSNVNTIRFRQETIPPQLSGRVNSIIRMVIAGSVPLSAFLYGAVVQHTESTLQWVPLTAGTTLAVLVWAVYLTGTRRRTQNTEKLRGVMT